MTVLFNVPSPKRRTSTESFSKLFPYYAGFPESFVRTVLGSKVVQPGAVIYDPWNGSGTTTAVASEMGLPSIGIDINPVMVIVAKARLLPRSELSSLKPLAAAVLERARTTEADLNAIDPLTRWFVPRTARILRAVERGIYDLLVEKRAGWTVDEISSMAAMLYVALFSSYREHTHSFRGSNPTWLKAPKDLKDRIRISFSTIEAGFRQAIDRVTSLYEAASDTSLWASPGEIRLADATIIVPPTPVDLVLTSPPYCTRIDYTAATRIELAIIDALMRVDPAELSRSMIGTTKVPTHVVERKQSWGETCNRFLDAVQAHKSKASSGYYLRTHLDYFDKMHRSMTKMTAALRKDAFAIMILQDSYYKDIHNDVPQIISEMAAGCGLELKQRGDFKSPNCMSRINSRSPSRESRAGAVESVLVFRKSG